MLLVFPAGTVSHLHLHQRQVADPPWNRAVARIVRSARAPVVPVFISGCNGALFQLLGLIHPLLRTALLAREFVNKRSRTISVKIGRPIAFRRLERFDKDSRLTEYLRWRTYLLEHCHRRPGLFDQINRLRTKRARRIAAEVPVARCRQDVEALPANRLLVSSGEHAVFVAEADQIPHLLLEIGRLREWAFREAGEGTGQPRDLDGFDAYYLHLFLWNRRAERVVGAYRIGRTDRILSDDGPAGLYTHTLFRQSQRLHQYLGPALELGRSFVLPEFQKSYAPLLLLWRGIGAYIAARPRYRYLFGPVSISRDYSDLSRRLIATTLLHHRQAADLSTLVKPRTPLKPRPLRVRGCSPAWPVDFCRDIEEVSSVVADIELAQRGVPVLLRHYLNLGGRLLAFNRDRNFGDVLDGLILVDLLDTAPRTLERYMSKEGAQGFLAFHRSPKAFLRAN
jgi:putative hemolysin